MPRPATGQVIAKSGIRGTVFALRFRAYGQRRYLTLGTEAEGWSHARAERELAYVLQQVERGVWQPASIEPTGTPEPDPTFHTFASDWWDAKKHEVRPNTVAAYEYELTHHLLPFFSRHLLSQITVAEVDRYREHKVREGSLSASTINKTITRLGQVLDVAEERELIARNPVRVNARNRKLKTTKKRPVHLDGVDQIIAVLDAARELDEAKVSRTAGRYALVATLLFAGPRASEAGDLLVRDLDLARGKLEIGRAKTEAGVRTVDVLPVLRDVLASYKAAHRGGLDDLLFTTRTGARRDRHNLARRVLAPVVKRADELLAERGQHPLPRGVSPHKLRHSFASILVACGRDPAYVMTQLGHADPAFTLRVYAHAMRFSEEERARLKALVEGADWPVMGTSDPSSAHIDPNPPRSAPIPTQEEGARGPEFQA